MNTNTHFGGIMFDLFASYPRLPHRHNNTNTRRAFGQIKCVGFDHDSVPDMIRLHLCLSRCDSSRGTLEIGDFALHVEFVVEERFAFFVI